MSALSTTWRRDLVSRYPAMFEREIRDAFVPFSDVGDGWRDLIELAVQRLAEIVRSRPGTTATIGIMTSKHGSLIMNVSGNYAEDVATRTQVELVMDLAEARSSCSCEICGEKGRLVELRGWLVTACERHSSGRRVSVEPGWEDLHIKRILRDGEFIVTSCRRYIRGTDSFVDVSPPDSAD